MRTVLLLTCLASVGCRPESGAMNFRHNRDGKGKPVATLGSDSITAEEVQARLAEMSPFARARYTTLEQKKEYVDGLARFEVLAQEAVRRGLQNDPDVIESAKKMMVQKLIQQELDNRAEPVSDAELGEYYQKHLSDYVKPEQVRLSDIFFAAPKTDSKARAEKKKAAEAALEKVKALVPMDFNGFGKLAREQSDDEKTKVLDGDMRYLSAQELNAQYPPEVAAAAASLKANGELSGLVETDRGFFLLKLQGRQAALNLTLDQVKPQLQNRILNERRQANFEKFVDSLKEKAGYRIDEAALAEVNVDPKAPVKEAKGPPPGFIQSRPGAMPR